MTMRRDNPDGALWRSAVEGFNKIIVDDVSKSAMNMVTDSGVSKTARIRFWKEVADIYEIFLVGYCGRALSFNYLSASTIKADETLEMTILDILGDRLLKSSNDAPNDVIFSFGATFFFNFSKNNNLLNFFLFIIIKSSSY